MQHASRVNRTLPFDARVMRYRRADARANHGEYRTSVAKALLVSMSALSRGGLTSYSLMA